MIGAMEIPPDFKYLDVFLKGKPSHERFDPFSLRHPRMDTGKRAKIFAPFAALRGFEEMVSSKEVLYTAKAELSAEDSAELSRRLDVLHNLTWNSRMARQNRVVVTATVFVPCADEHHAAFGTLGQYHTVRGVCLNVDPDVSRTIRIDDSIVAFENIMKIESEGDVFSLSERTEDF